MPYVVRMSINTKFIVAFVSSGESAAEENKKQAETYREKVSNWSEISQMYRPCTVWFT